MSTVATLYQWLLFAHVLAAMAWLGGALLLGITVTSVLRSGEPDSIVRFTSGLRSIGPRLLAPATLGVLAFGLWMVLDSPAWKFGHFWVELALGLFAGAALIGAAWLSQTSLRAERAAESGDTDEAVRQLTRWSRGYRLVILLLVIAAWDMVFKPGL